MTLDAKRHIVMALARREKHDDIVAQVHEHFGIDIHKRALRHYNPKYNQRLDLELQTLFERTARQHWEQTNRRVDELFACRRREREKRDAEMLARMKRRIREEVGLE